MQWGNLVHLRKLTSFGMMDLLGELQALEDVETYWDEILLEYYPILDILRRQEMDRVAPHSPGVSHQCFPAFANLFQTSYAAEVTLVPQPFSLSVILFPGAPSFLNSKIKIHTAPLLIQDCQPRKADNGEEAH